MQCLRIVKVFQFPMEKDTDRSKKLVSAKYKKAQTQNYTSAMIKRHE